jgi:cytochrome c biogenesis protein CcdA
VKFLLYLAYYVEGFMMAIVACSCIGLALAVLVALVKSFARPKNLLLALMYAAGAFVCYLLFFAGLHLAGWIGDRTHYVGQGGIIVGAIFPGILSLKIIPQFFRVASLQTSGIHVE